jgi:hypothetical protein
VTPGDALDVVEQAARSAMFQFDPIVVTQALDLLREYVETADPVAPLNAQQVREVWARCAQVPVENLPNENLAAFLVGLSACAAAPVQDFADRVLAEFTAYTQLRRKWAERVDLGVVWVPGRWWRVNLPDGTCWSETSDPDEARDALVTGREAAQQRELDGEPVLLRFSGRPGAGRRRGGDRRVRGRAARRRDGAAATGRGAGPAGRDRARGGAAPAGSAPGGARRRRPRAGR